MRVYIYITYIIFLRSHTKCVCFPMYIVHRQCEWFSNTRQDSKPISRIESIIYSILPRQVPSVPVFVLQSNISSLVRINLFYWHYVTAPLCIRLISCRCCVKAINISKIYSHCYQCKMLQWLQCSEKIGRSWNSLVTSVNQSPTHAYTITHIEQNWKNVVK